MAENIPVRPLAGARSPAQDRPPRPPKHLSAGAKRMWRAIVAEWVLGPEALPLLQASLESWDLYQKARAQLAADGPTVKSGRGMIRQHPAAKVANDALTQFRQAFRQLALQPPEE